jgi:hypothetical protein
MKLANPIYRDVSHSYLLKRAFMGETKIQMSLSTAWFG